MIGIIGAMDSEVEILLSKLDSKKEEKHGGTLFYSGTLCGKEVVIAKCGIGKVCAAICAQTMIDLYGVECLINTGVAGGIASGIAVGDIVIAKDLIQHDFDLTEFGYAKGYLPCSGQSDSSLPTRFAADPALVDAFCEAAHNTGVGKAVIGTVVSGDIFVSSSAKKEELISLYGASATEMEGAAIAQAAFLSGVSFAVIRAISDSADEEASVSFEEFEKKAAEVSSNMTLEFLRTYKI